MHITVAAVRIALCCAAACSTAAAAQPSLVNVPAAQLWALPAVPPPAPGATPAPTPAAVQTGSVEGAASEQGTAEPAAAEQGTAESADAAADKAVAEAPEVPAAVEPQRDPLAPLDSADEDLPSPAVQQITAWVIATGDNNQLPFMVIDKVQAKVFVHLADGTLVGTAPALLGLARKDDSAPGIGKRKLSLIGNSEKTTPAGRFVAQFGPAAGHERVLWVDYPTSISMHPVITSNPKERRLQRLKSPSPRDNRITFGCINVFPDFYKKVVQKTFKGTTGIVYILPETKPLNDVFLAFRPVPPASAVSGGN